MSKGKLSDQGFVPASSVTLVFSLCLGVSVVRFVQVLRQYLGSLVKPAQNARRPLDDLQPLQLLG
jgi:hypothetical protein